MKLSKIVSILLFAILATSCVSHDYMGQTYPSTTEVKVYYAESDIVGEYEIMGVDRVSAPDAFDAQLILEKIQEKAMEVGADAVIIDDFHEQTIGSSTWSNGSSTHSSDGKGNSNSTNWGSVSSTTTENEKIVVARFVKFK
ncbi:hypothetical protein [Phaeocystidibacter luteus]|uniref:DUF4156 domain-containing protein n=1 Tax=Phaeocystidibacter luteus TaxID=911197 RepID=A0A6N6RE51_9FLAO|nr:hypothetical protein [Phaeocystidibacter luteus]KAB2808023.1 hypothetical protein F8C67_10655 [Phaeocystidibacter luteus]